MRAMRRRGEFGTELTGSDAVILLALAATAKSGWPITVLQDSRLYKGELSCDLSISKRGET